MLRAVALVVVGVLATLTGLVIASVPAVACDCIPKTTSEQADSADVVARVIIERTRVGKPDRNGHGQQVSFTMRPTHVWKGDVTSQFILTSELEIPACGLGALNEGTDLLVFAHQGEEGMSASWCGGTMGYNEALVTELNAVAGPGVAVDVAPKDGLGVWMVPAVRAVVAVGGASGVIVLWLLLPR